MLPMNPKEFEKWTLVRKGGSNKYAATTSFIATNAVFLLHFIVNGYRNLAEIDKYIAYNATQVDAIVLTLVILFIGLFIASKVLYHINDKRYVETEKQKNNPGN